MWSFLLDLLQDSHLKRFIFVSKRNVFDALIQLDFTEPGNPHLCWTCYKMAMSLKKAADDLEAKKQELSMKMKSSTAFFCLPTRSPDKGFLTSSPDTRSPLAKRVRRRNNEESQMSLLVVTPITTCTSSLSRSTQTPRRHELFQYGTSTSWTSSSSATTIEDLGTFPQLTPPACEYVQSIKNPSFLTAYIPVSCVYLHQLLGQGKIFTCHPISYTKRPRATATSCTFRSVIVQYHECSRLCSTISPSQFRKPQ